MTNDIRIETERLQLRSWRERDVDVYEQACNTPAVMRWLGDIQSRAEVEQDIEYFNNEEARRGHTYWAIERKADGAFLGFCGLVRIPDEDCPFRGEVEIGWRIREDEWRNGYAFEAARATRDYAFDRQLSEKIVSRTAGGNVASQGIMLKLGMRHDPGLEYWPDGEVEALRTYVINRASWRARVRRTEAARRSDPYCLRRQHK